MTRLSEIRNNQGKLPSYTSYGCYPLYYLTGKDEVLCPHCANVADKDPDNALEDKPSAVGTNWESTSLYCDACDEPIECAYPPDTDD